MKSARKNFLHCALLLAFAQVLFFGSARAQDGAAGQALAEKHCVRCHAIAKTDTSTHKDAPTFREIVTRYPPASLAEALAEGISTGHPDMPEFVFSPKNGDDLIAYLESLQ